MPEALRQPFPYGGRRLFSEVIELADLHPDVEECFIYIEYYETEHEFDIWAHYEITVMERIGP